MQNDKCPEGEKAQKKFYKKKGLMATWDDSESEEDSEEEQATIALMGIAKFESEAELSSEDESDSDEDEVLSLFTPSELKASLFEMMEKYDFLLSKHKVLKKNFLITSEASDIKEQIISELNDKILVLNSSNLSLRSKTAKLEEEITSNTSESESEKKYEKSFQYFLSRNLDRSKMASLIYGVSRNHNEGLGYSESCEKHKTLNTKPKALYEHFVPSGTHVRSSEPAHSKGGQRRSR